MPTARSNKTPQAATPADIEEQANANAREAASDAGYVGIGTPPQPPKPSHAARTRPADAGFVAGSIKDAQARQGQYAGGEQVFASVPEMRMTANQPGRDNKPAEQVEATGEPDLPAIEKHNQHVREVTEATQQSFAAAGQEVPGAIATHMTTEEKANKDDVFEGNVPDPEDADKK